MERSPRSAGVPRTGASMGQCHTLRSFVISLAIAIAISKSPASGFTLARDLTKPDLETGESKQLEVKYDLKSSNNNGQIHNKTREDSNSTVIAIKDINNNRNYSDRNVTEKQLIVNKTDTQKNASENFKIEVPSHSSTVNSTETARNAFNKTAHSTNKTTQTASFASNTTEPSTIQTTKTASFASNTTVPSKIQSTSPESERSQAFSTTSSAQTTPPDKSVIENSTVTNIIEKNEIITAKHKNNDIEDVTTTVTLDTNIVTNNDFTVIQPLVTTNIPAHSVITTIDDSKSIFTTESVLYDQKADQTNTKEENTKANTESSLDAPTTTSSATKTKESGGTDVTLENFTAEVFNIELDTSKLPPWKKYTTIDRKRTSTEETTITGKDMTRAETAQTRLSLEKVFTNAPVPSLEKITSGLIDAQESTTRQLETSFGIKSSLPSSAETYIYTAKMDTEVETETSKLEIVSRRAGYKDNRETTTPKLEEATTTKLSLTVSTNNKDVYSTMYETGEVEVTRNKNSSVYESQSQLAEDAIKEELLKEETLNNEENAKFLKESIIDASPEIVTVDVLSVKPIGQEKKKNTILYVVSPNYKAPKKIDVQPLKQFVRDPDDNSWRNESISSLGIVFKPKNASKSFTQVLKNKTETELGNMTDKYSKDDLPDLRVRLEKIAEVRKSKKRVNKFGDTVYSDYEESSENTYLYSEDKTTPMTPFPPTMDTTFKIRPTPPSQISTTEFDLRNAIPKDHYDLFKTERTPLTTHPYKPKKFYNLAEYYDSTDEYDADYVNQHKIDLKKFTKPMKITEDISTRPPEQLSTQPMTEYQPERKATLQYFPPTLKPVQKVNMNDYDANFNRKVNLYQINKDPPKDVQAVSFGTISPIPTEKYGPYNKATMKPNYTPMYQPDNLDKNLYLTNQPLVSEPTPSDGTFNRASYVIKHYRDFISEAAKDDEDERNEDYTYTETPVRGVTVNDIAKMTPRDGNQGEEDYEYDVKYRKDIMNRFVDNFNQNSERFKVDFPILYNSSVVHRPPEHGQVASSSAFMKRLYEVENARPSNFLRRPCDPNCDKTVELSPAYELHYYVPDEEEKEQIEPRPATPPYRFRL